MVKFEEMWFVFQDNLRCSPHTSSIIDSSVDSHSIETLILILEKGPKKSPCLCPGLPHPPPPPHTHTHSPSALATCLELTLFFYVLSPNGINSMNWFILRFKIFLQIKKCISILYLFNTDASTTLNCTVIRSQIKPLLKLSEKDLQSVRSTLLRLLTSPIALHGLDILVNCGYQKKKM